MKWHVVVQLRGDRVQITEWVVQQRWLRVTDWAWAFTERVY